MQKLKVAILGSGNIGTDLLVKILRSSYLECSLFIGRYEHSHGIIKAKQFGVPTSDRRISAILDNPDCCDLVFDATSAESHLIHWPLLQQIGKAVIDLTPSLIGKMVVPYVGLPNTLESQNINLISCGGQASIPLAYALSQVCENLKYVEVVSSISSKSAGPATRANLDEYIENTERGLRFFTGTPKAKAILILNPAEPEIHMQTTIYAKLANLKIDNLNSYIQNVVRELQTYVPGYCLAMPPSFKEGLVSITVRVMGAGDYLPKYAGNLDIINCAAIQVAETYARKRSELLCEDVR